MLNRKRIKCDLCVVGGGMSGMAAAIAAAREGLKVVLMHERAVLGGNASSEIRMWICGSKGEDNKETGILEEISLENLYRNPTKSYAIWDTVLYDFIRREENITLLLNCTCMDAEAEKGEFANGRDTVIKSVTGYQMTTQTFYDVEAKFYSDCSGDSILAPLTGAHFKIGREAKSDFGEDTVVEVADKMTMGMSCILQGRETLEPVKYIAPQWSTKLNEEIFKNKKCRVNLYEDTENFWYLELGGDRDSIGDTEELRDELVALATGTWDYLKNTEGHNAENWDLEFLGFLPGKRESRRMCGEYMITQRDISDGVVFDDEIAYGGWPLDDHFPGGFWHVGTPNTNFKTPAPYSIPYRALYSENVENLFFAGRNISMTHMAMSSIRVMATCMLLGDAVGRASAIAVKKGLTPHGVYLNEIESLQKSIMNADNFLPSRVRAVSDTCKNAELNAPDTLRNGQDRGHRIYSTTQKTASYQAPLGKEITYSFNTAEVKSLHLVFSSDLNRETLPGSNCERIHTTRSNIKLDSPQMHMPKTLCREFTLYGELEGKREELLTVSDNRRRAYHLELGRSFDKFVLIPIASWGEDNTVDIISFDFE
ncbi:MAG: FAD-dependent oxidoreductase [Clostridia bacterium]|nr:FAD-dependent oxidoreductase [Clostridia bacterium]